MPIRSQRLLPGTDQAVELSWGPAGGGEANLAGLRLRDGSDDKGARTGHCSVGNHVGSQDLHFTSLGFHFGESG